MYKEKSGFILIGDTTLYVEGLYSRGSSESAPANDGQTAPLKPDFEITSIMLVPKVKGENYIDVTQLLEDINSVTWRKDTGNDIFERITEKILQTVNDQS